jgi:signal peptidase I
VIVLRTWYLEGLPVPVCVDSGSMAETLLGPHRKIVCGDCGFAFVCGCVGHPSDPRAVCPNCGYSDNDVRDWPELPGDRVLVHRAMFQLRQPRRWEVVALRTPGRERELSTKRVVGLPGESVEIRDGDVYVNGTIARKTLNQQRAMSILVHDACYMPHRITNVPPRWRHDAKDSGWSCQDGRFVYSIGAKAVQPPGRVVDWLNYRHWRRVPGQPDKVEEGPVLTESSYNQGHRVPAASIRPTADLRLSFRWVRASGQGWLCVRATDGQEEFLLRIDSTDRRMELLHNGERIEVSSPDRSVRARWPLQVDVSLVDRQFLAALNGCTLAAFPFPRPERNGQPSPNPFALGGEDVEMELDQVCVFRDAYYDSAKSPAVGCKLASGSFDGGGELIVLGDNAPFSDDSRTWPQGPALSEHAVIGKPFLVHLPIQRVQVGGWWFRIPDFAAIRYIR